MARLPAERWPIAPGLFGMETAKDYLKFAEECRSLAKRAENSRHKAILEQMAEAWLRLAREAERKSARAGRDKPDTQQ